MTVSGTVPEALGKATGTWHALLAAVDGADVGGAARGISNKGGLTAGGSSALTVEPAVKSVDAEGAAAAGWSSTG